MFTLIRNYKTLFMMCVANYQQANGPDQVSSAIDDKVIDTVDINALMEIPEAQEAILAKMEGELVLTAEIATELGDITPDAKRNNPTMKEQKTIQFIINLHRKLLDQTPIGVDGQFGGGSKNALKEIVASYDGGIIDQSTISGLIMLTNARLKAKIQEIQDQREAKEKEETDARAIVQAFDVDADKTDSEKVKVLQTALKTLGYTLRGRNGGVDGHFSEGGTTEAAYKAELEKIASAQRSSASETAAEDVAEAKRVLDRAITGDLKSDVDAARERGEMERAEDALEAANQAATDSQAALDAAKIDFSNTSMDSREAGREASQAQAAVDRAVQAAADSQAALDAAKIAFSNTSMDTRELGRAMSDAQAAVDRAVQAAADSQNALIDATREEGELERERDALQDAQEEAQTALTKAIENRDSLPSVEEAVAIREAITARVVALGYERDLGSQGSYTLEQAQKKFDGNERLYSSAARGGTFLENVQNTTTRWPTSRDDHYFESAMILARVQEQAAREAEELVKQSEAANDLAVSALSGGEAALEAAQTALAQAESTDTAADANLEAKNALLATATQEAAAARVALESAQTALAQAESTDTAADADLVTKRNEYNRERGEYQDAAADAGLIDKAVTQAKENLEAAEAAELEAYINELTQGGANTELVTMLTEKSAEMRSLINNLRQMPASKISDLGAALGYFDATSSHVGASELSGEMLVDIVKYAQSQNIDISRTTGEYLISLSTAYQAKADEIAQILIQRGKWLDDRKAAFEDYFNTTVGYPDLEYVQQVEVEGSTSPMQVVNGINNGFRGRPRTHTTITSTTTDTYLTTNTHHVVQDSDGETVSSRHPEGKREHLGTQTISSASTRSWFEMHQGGIEREEIAGLLGSGEATLRPSYRMLSRLYEPTVVNGQVTLEKQDWYAAMDKPVDQGGWDEATEMERINTEVNISSKTLSGSMAEVKREAPDRYAEIQSEVRTDLLARDEFSFLVWGANTGETATATQIIGRKQILPSGKEVWALATFNPTTGEVITRENYSDGEQMLASAMGQKAIEMSSYRYLGVTDSSTENGLRGVDDQGLIRCGEHEKVVLLDDPMPELPQGYNFLRNGLPCGVLGAYCTSSSVHSNNIREYEQNKWTYETIREPDGDGPDGGGREGVGSNPGVGDPAPDGHGQTF